MGVGKRIKELREKNGMSQGKLAKKVKCLNQSQICKIENEDRAVKATELVIIANALNVSITELVS